jgi:nitroreductase
MDAMELLLTRSSGVKLAEPAPSDAEFEQILKAAVRAPDHGRLKPWRFLSIRGTGREKLGELYVETAQLASPHATPEALGRERDKALRAPLVVIVIARLSTLPNVKVPEVEQLLSAGAAAQNILLAAHALGYAAVWKTGDVAYHHHFKTGLGLAANEHIIGILFVGTRADAMGNKPGPDVAPFHSVWPA